MTSEQICQRSDILGTQVITRDRGKRLGVVSQLWVDIDRREVVAIGLRDNIFAVAGMPRFMFLSNVSEIGDVLLVEDESAIEDDVDVEVYSILINSEVITETGELLGRVRGFRFDPEDGKLVSIIIASLGIPQIPDQVLSTYELGIEEIVSSGPNRLIVFEGSEERLRQLSVGLLERVGLGQAPWEREEDEQGYYPKPVATGNQFGPGVRIPAPEMRSRVAAPAVEEVPWDEDSQWNRPAVRSRCARCSLSRLSTITRITKRIIGAAKRTITRRSTRRSHSTLALKSLARSSRWWSTSTRMMWRRMLGLTMRCRSLTRLLG